MDVGLLSLKWDNHSLTFSQALLNIRNREDYCDATIACDGKFYKVHKLIMSTCSKYLEQLFDKANLCCSVVAHPVIFLQDVQHEHLEALLDYMYVGEVNVKQTDLPLLIKAAECLKIKGLAVPDDLSSENQTDKQKKNRKYNCVESEEKSNKNQEALQERREFGSTKRRNSEDNERNTLKPSVSPSYELNGVNKKRLRIDDYSQEKNVSNLEQRNMKMRNKEIGDDPQCLENSLDHSEVKIEPSSVYTEDEYISSNEPSFESNFNFNNHTNLLENAPLDFDNINQSHGTHQSYSDTKSTTDIQITPVYRGSQISTWERHEQSQEHTSISNSSTFFTAQQHSSPVPTDVNDIWQQAIQNTPAGVACPFCSKVYTNRSAFRYHYKTHTGEKPYACPHCPQRFILRGDMMKHVKIHTGEKPFSCPHCSHTFIQKSNMKDHIYRHHPEANMPAPKRCIVMNSNS